MWNLEAEDAILESSSIQDLLSHCLAANER